MTKVSKKRHKLFSSPGNIFGTDFWGCNLGGFIHEYKESMAAFTYCPTKQCVVEVTALEYLSCGSSIATNDSDYCLNDMVSKWGLEYHLDLEDNQEYSFDLTNQVTLHIGADGCGILGDAGDDSGTVRTDCSAATQGTTKLKATINYLLCPLSNHHQDLTTRTDQAASQAAGQLPLQAAHQACHPSDNQPVSQPPDQDQALANSLQTSSTTLSSSVPPSSTASALAPADSGTTTATASAVSDSAPATVSDRLKVSLDG